MHWRLGTCVVLCSVLLVAGALDAWALDATDMILAFGTQYNAPDGSTCTHRGIDVAADGGSRVRAPRAGRVCFAGSVPGPHGGTVRAVTIETAEGKVSLMPFDALDVSRGDEVDVGQAIGRLAEEGDPSSPSPHVHVSLRHGDLYVDPAVLCAPAAQPQPPAEQTQPEPAESPSPAPAPAAATMQPAISPLSAGASLAAASASVAKPSITQAPRASASERSGQVAEPLGAGVCLAPEPGVATQVGSAQTGMLAPYVPTAEMGAADRLGRVCSEVALGAIRWLRGADASSVVGVVMAMAACAGLLGKRAFERRIESNPPVSDRLGRLLQQLRAGDTLRGLTSCSGPLPSQSRGRTAQRR